jgi:hypothetical protein
MTRKISDAMAALLEKVVRCRCGFEGRAGLDASEVWSAFVTAESEEVELRGFMEAFQSPRHGMRIFLQMG